MKILVMIKQVPDTATKIRLNPGDVAIQTDGIKWVINPYDEFAIEECLRLREKFGGEVVAVSLGPSRVEEALRQALAMGADRAVHITTDAALDSLAAAKALAQVARDEGFDLVVTGKQAVDDDQAQVGPLVAVELGLPQVTVVIKLEVDPEAKTIRAERELEGASEIVELPMPAVITAQRGLNEPRYPTLPNIMKAKKKELKPIALDSLGIDTTPVVRIEALTLPPERPAAKILTGEPEETAKELARLLHEEAKVI
ncbi:electron transfer flavoprotein subunit beta/FixA family protein [Sulfobacillus harzensis]|uniref:Electron transfer flavoprotein subunit beta n=1 Tax=Sulfobacillus harzensis TaxID=2729629 RepID=A0A7Y0L5U4_9FIRM|nr:electron transfer flavoprotein subunit beta/FixA family protein [Sulfobacillus harzensis]NMP23849.1 electron transfer flavoprotein subunit beta/FixA family protein [Sulfobacillus harzensis]